MSQEDLNNKNRIEDSSLNAGRDIHIGDVHHHQPPNVVVHPIILNKEKGKSNYLVYLFLLLVSITLLFYYMLKFNNRESPETNSNKNTTTSSFSSLDTPIPKGNIYSSTPQQSTERTDYGLSTPSKPMDSEVSLVENPKIVLLKFIKGNVFDIPGNEGVLSFRLTQNEVTVAQYLAFCRATGTDFPYEKVDTSMPQLPIRHVSWNSANAYCEYVGGHLPTSNEWLIAVKYILGEDSSLYAEKISSISWNYLNSEGRLHSVGSRNSKSTAFPLYDLFGNVEEWCSDGPADGLKYTLGGYYRSLPQEDMFLIKSFSRATFGSGVVGFRVAYSY